MLMFRRTATHRRLTWPLLGCLLFAQAALAALPCLSAKASATDAFAAAPADCHEPPPANLCLAQCVASDQSSGPAPAALAPPPSWTLEVIPVVSPPAGRTAGFDPYLAARALGPPPFLRVCSLLL
jgi:hypothetical protein